MKVRVITAIVGILAVLALVYLGSWFLTGAILVVSLLALLEYDKMLRHFNVHMYVKPTALSMGIMVLSAGFYSVKSFMAFVLLAFILLLYLILGIKKENMTGLVYSAFGALYTNCYLLPMFPSNQGFSSFFLLSFVPGLVTLLPIWQEDNLANIKWRLILALIRR